MPLVVLDARIEGARAIKGLAKRLGPMKKEAMRTVGQAWVDKVLATHFTPGNESRYRMEKRNAFYKNVVKKIEGEGQGKFVSLTLKGKSLRWLRAFAKVSPTHNRVTIRMTAPTYFTSPYTGKIKKEVTEKDGRRHEITLNIKHQPDKVAELIQVNAEDKERLQKIMVRELKSALKKSMNP